MTFTPFAGMGAFNPAAFSMGALAPGASAAAGLGGAAAGGAAGLGGAAAGLGAMAGPLGFASLGLQAAMLPIQANAQKQANQQAVNNTQFSFGGKLFGDMASRLNQREAAKDTIALLNSPEGISADMRTNRLAGRFADRFGTQPGFNALGSRFYTA